MERLSDNAIEILNELHTERLEYATEYVPLVEAIGLLAAYEDTKKTPEEINDMEEMLHSYRHICYGVTPERLKELVEADREGRCNISPVKPGDAVFFMNQYRGCVTATTIISLEFTSNGLIEIGAFGGEYCPVRFAPDKIGKTIFLAREAAEKALQDCGAKLDLEERNGKA